MRGNGEQENDLPLEGGVARDEWHEEFVYVPRYIPSEEFICCHDCLHGCSISIGLTNESDLTEYMKPHNMRAKPTTGAYNGGVNLNCFGNGLTGRISTISARFDFCGQAD